jgi:hypothetical protein
VTLVLVSRSALLSHGLFRSSLRRCPHWLDLNSSATAPPLLVPPQRARLHPSFGSAVGPIERNARYVFHPFLQNFSLQTSHIPAQTTNFTYQKAVCRCFAILWAISVFILRTDKQNQVHHKLNGDLWRAVRFLGREACERASREEEDRCMVTRGAGMLFLPMASTVAGSGPRERNRNDERKRFKAVAFRDSLVRRVGGRRSLKPHFSTGRRHCEQEPVLFIVLHTKSGSMVSSLVRWQAGRISFHWRDKDRH